MPLPKIKFLLYAILLGSAPVLAQNTSGGSPYSKYGIGDLRGTDFALTRSMGGANLGLQNVTQINLGNPASLAALKITSLEIGAEGRGLKLQTNNQSLTKNYQNLSYIALGFPVGKHFGTSFGLMPYSRVDYNIVNAIRNVPIARNEIYKGTGGANKYFLALGAKINKNFYVGATANYLDGSIREEIFIVFPDTGAYYNQRTTKATEPNGLLFSGGLQYKAKLKENSHLTIGATYQHQQNVNTLFIRTTDRFRLGREGQYIIKDTILSQNTKTKTVVPSTFGIGVCYEPNAKLLLSADYSRQNWQNAKIIASTDSLTTRQTIALGMQYTPSKTALRGQYFKVVSYRLGGYYTQSQVVVNNLQIREFGVSAGMGLPITDRVAFSQCNLTIDAGQRGTLQNSLILERFVRLTVGFTLSDKWFIKRKYD